METKNTAPRLSSLSEEQQKEYYKTLENPAPTTFKMGRNLNLQLPKIGEDVINWLMKNKAGGYVISGVQKHVNEFDYVAFSFAVSQILYNQSYQSGNTDTNSGLKKIKVTNVSEMIGEVAYSGRILVKPNDLCRKGYGTEPTTELKKRITTLIETLHNIFVKVSFKQKDTFYPLCKIESFSTDKKDRTKIIEYELKLHPIFSYEVKNNFGELPQNIIAKLDAACKKRKQRKQTAHYYLLRWLAIQDKNYPHPLNIDTLVKGLRMEEYYKENKQRATSQILSICDIMKDIEILREYEVVYEYEKPQNIRQIIFHLNPNFIRLKDKGKRMELEEGEN